MSHALLYQDYRSAILLEVNGKLSSSKRTKYINTKYFYVKDQVDRGEVKIEHLGTEEMWADILTKPKQGKAFCQDRAKLMSCPVDWQEPGVICSERLAPKSTTETPNPAKAITELVRPMVCPKRAVFKDISNEIAMPIRAIHA